ncbi:HIRAN domain-containing protein [Streptomyces sp. NPDC102490]|uniref:HIRAN domain-containing protein n=1 Tax=Streptomyces sp. NPDC102490 TaxID=3366183 RepID=UPI0038074697
MPTGAPLHLVRDPEDEADPNAIQVQHQGVFLGWIAREIARSPSLSTRAATSDLQDPTTPL